MKKSISILSFAILIATLISCKKEAFNGLTDLRPAVPVTITNAIDFRPDPTVASSKSGGGTIQIILTIPAASGRTIKEITKVAASTSFTQIQSTGTTGFYISVPIPVNNISYTFNSSLSEYTAKTKDDLPDVDKELPKRFYFMITLDDGSIIISQPVRVLVIK